MIELNKIYHGDCLQVMRTWPDSFINCVVTSPPYWGLRDYGVAGQIGLEKTPEEFVAKMVEIFREVRRVLREDGTLWLNLGDSYAGGGRGGGSDDCKQRTNVGSLIKAPKWSDAGNLKAKDLCMMPARVAMALQADGWYLRSDIIWAKPNPMPESVTDRPTKAHEYLFLLTKNERYFYDAEAIKERCTDVFLNDSRHETGSRSNTDRDAYLAAGAQDPKGPHRIFNKRPSVKRGGFNGKTNALLGREAFRAVTEIRNKRTVWTIATTPFPDAHFATFPEKLIEPCIMAGAPEGGIVFDPFMGAGTTALVAARLNRKFIGTELNPEYIAMAGKRIAPEVAQKKFA